MKNKNEIDMINGPLTGKIIMFTLPLMMSSLLQIFYNATDMIVVGRFAGSTALAAVGSTSSIINLAVNIFSGLAIGTNILLAQYIGAEKNRDVSETLHTSVAVSLILGVILVTASIFFVKPVLTAMQTPEDILPQAVTYLKIYFMGSPAILLYNYGSAVMRSSGDTKRPLYFLAFSGILNILLNLLLVIRFDMGTAGVAIATVFAQYVSAALVVIALVQNDGASKLIFRKIRVVPEKLKKLMLLGIPASVQSAVFSISNMLIQSSINSFGAQVVAGNSAAANLEAFVYSAMSAFGQAALVFTGQNVGAKKYERLHKIIIVCSGMIFVSWGMTSVIIRMFSRQLLGIYLPDDAGAVKYGIIRFSIIMNTYFLCGIMEIPAGALRGMGKSSLPAAVSLLGVCLFRVIWIFTVFQKYHTLKCLYLSYPLSWIITETVHFICYFAVYRKLKKSLDSSFNTPPEES